MMKENTKVVMLLAKDFMHPYFDPRVYKEAKSLVEKGYNVSVVCWGNFNEDAPHEEVYEGIDVLRVFQKIPSHAPFFLRMPWYGLYLLKTVQKSLNLKPDVIHAHDLETLAAGVGLKLLLKKPLIFDAHEDFPSALEQMDGEEIGQFGRVFEKILIHFATTVIAAEIPYVDIMQKHYNISPKVIMNLPDIRKFNKDVDPALVIKEFDLEGKIVLSYIGGVGQGRGVEDTIQAIPYMKNREDIKFLVVGKTTKECRKKLIELTQRVGVEDKVIFCLEGIEYNKIPRYYAASDICIMLHHSKPSWVIALPTKLFESIATGTPVLCGIYPYLKDFVTRYDVGLFANPKDHKEVAAKLDILINDPQLREKMGQNGWMISQDKFNWSNAEKILLGIYENILAGNVK